MTKFQFDPRQLLDHAAYPWPVDEVRLIETHISWVYLAGDRVVKLKRPVDLGFVDFRDPGKRHRACLDEVRLNQRLTTDVYLGVVPVTAQGVDASGEPIEWAVVMRRLPADRMLDRLLLDGTAPGDLAMRLADQLIPFHSLSSRPEPAGGVEGPLVSVGYASELEIEFRGNERFLHLGRNDGESSPRSGVEGVTREGTEALHYDHVESTCPGEPDTYLAVLTDNLTQVADVAHEIVGTAQLAFVDRSMRGFMREQGELLAARFPEWLREGHGDLRCEHICLEPDAMQIYDCVEFEIAIRCADVASDLAFLLMDLRRLGAEPVAAELLKRYRDAGFDLPQPVVDLYAAHRALVRCKVAALERAGQDAEADRRFAFEAASYLDIATSFACPTPPMLVLVSGLSGSGKSTVAAAVGRMTNGVVLASDRVRKELAGLDPSESAASDWQQGIYTGDWTARTYDRLLALADDALAQGRTAVVDATFLDNAQRERFARLASERGVPLAIVWTELDDAIAQARIEHRVKERNDPSDATMAVRQQQIIQLAATPIVVPAGAMAVTIDTGIDGPASLDPLVTALDATGLMGSLWAGRVLASRGNDRSLSPRSSLMGRSG